MRELRYMVKSVMEMSDFLFDILINFEIARGTGRDLFLNLLFKATFVLGEMKVGLVDYIDVL